MGNFEFITGGIIKINKICKKPSEKSDFSSLYLVSWHLDVLLLATQISKSKSKFSKILKTSYRQTEFTFVYLMS